MCEHHHATPSLTLFYIIDSATRKAKFFLHPYKLPHDLTVKQTQLFRTIWNELQEKKA